MPHRLPPRAGLRQFAFDSQANHHDRHTRALSASMHGLGAKVAKLMRISKRVVQYWQEPYGEKEGPFERASRLTHVLVELGSPDPYIPLREVAAEHGFALQPLNTETDGESLLRKLGEAVSAHGEFTATLTRALEDGVLTLEEIQEIRSNYDTSTRKTRSLLEEAEIKARSPRSAA